MLKYWQPVSTSENMMTDMMTDDYVPSHICPRRYVLNLLLSFYVIFSLLSILFFGHIVYNIWDISDFGHMRLGT